MTIAEPEIVTRDACAPSSIGCSVLYAARPSTAVMAQPAQIDAGYTSDMFGSALRMKTYSIVGTRADRARHRTMAMVVCRLSLSFMKHKEPKT